MTHAKKEQTGFEQLLRQLEAAVTELEQGQLTMEDMLEKYAKGVELIRVCRGILQEAAQVLPQESREGELWS